MFFVGQTKMSLYGWVIRWDCNCFETSITDVLMDESRRCVGGGGKLVRKEFNLSRNHDMALL